MRIFIDLDDVTVDLASEWLRLYNERRDEGAWEMDYEPDPHITHEQFFDQWDIEKSFPGANDILNTPGLFRYLRPFPGAVESINELRKHHDVLFLTSGLSETAASEKLQFVEHTFDYEMKRNTIVTYRKDVIGGFHDLLIDDRPDNVKSWKGKSILFRRHHNRNTVWSGPNKATAEDWPTVMKKIQSFTTNTI